MSQFYNDSIFWIEVDKIKPNPFQPRREFDPDALRSLADSIRQYGVLQALVVTRNEVQKPDGGIAVEYELIAGERRLRASRLAGLTQVPCLIKTGDESNLVKLELAIIENLQREDLNPVERAKAFKQLVDEFKMKHADIGKKIGKSREYVSNTLRLLMLPEEMLQALTDGKISEGHARPLLMVADKPEEQMTLFKEMVYKKLNVRESERVARKIATDRVRKKEYITDPQIAEIEEKLSEALGTRVQIEKKDTGGKILIDFFSPDDLDIILSAVALAPKQDPQSLLKRHEERLASGEVIKKDTGLSTAEAIEAVREEGGIRTGSVGERAPEVEIEHTQPETVVNEETERVAEVAVDMPKLEESVPAPKQEDETYSLDSFSI